MSVYINFMKCTDVFATCYKHMHVAMFTTLYHRGIPRINAKYLKCLVCVKSRPILVLCHQCQSSLT